MSISSNLDYILKKYNLTPVRNGPTEIPNMGRDNLASLFAELGFKLGAEIGVEQGLYSEVLCKANPGLRLYCVDAWTAYRGYRDHVSQEKLDKFLANARERLSPYTAEIYQMFSMDAVKLFGDKSLDFVYIDGNHEIPWVMDDICMWGKKVKVGGIIAGHDYYESKRKYTKNHVKYVVDAVMRSYRVNPWFLVGTKAKTPGLIRDTSRSWFFIKE